MHITSFLLPNLHCPSCVSTIEDVLDTFDPAPGSVSSSIVRSWVTVRHDLSLSPTAIRNAREDAGFDVRSVVIDDKRRKSQYGKRINL
jgi:copper chaperone CopZ